MIFSANSTSPVLRIGTRDSRLALWQAGLVQEKLEALGHSCELVPVKSEGDIDTITPLYEMGVQGIFTRSLDSALLNGRVDLAVHSFKDVPTRLATGIAIAAVLERGNTLDLCLLRDGVAVEQHDLVIGTSSIRRRAQWIRRHRAHHMQDLRGNIDTRLRKLQMDGYDGVIMAAAGLERAGVRPANAIELDWMLPAPSQGAIVIVCREQDQTSMRCVAPLDHASTALSTALERDFLRHLHGGCSSPIGALATIEENEVRFRGNVLSVDGKEMMEVEMTELIGNDAASLGLRAAEELLRQGADLLIGKQTSA
ncbi:MAG: hydroxymethylbilane synthase [Bacteroidota bacterium]|nr:hydroxymethylbilane synthase [Bacteroidota bacterium]